MESLVNALAAWLSHLAVGLANAVAGTGHGWLALGVALHLANQVTRGRGWWAIVRAATCDDPRLRRRDAIGAWIAGAGAGGVVTARAGDALRVGMLARRLPDAGAAVLAGTLVAEAAGELAGGVVLLAFAAAVGIRSPLSAAGPDLWFAALAIALAATAIAGVVLARRRRSVPRERAIEPTAPRRIVDGLRRGCAPLGQPGAYVRRVAPWQLVSRLCRLAAVGCFLTAFHLPATPAAVLLVIVAQGSGRLVPFAPVAVGAGAAVLAATFAPVTGSAAPASDVAAFLIGTSTVLTAVGILLAGAITFSAAGWRSLPRAASAAWRVSGRALAAARRA
jgi:hypothetical protein